jgi:predicted CXXCH cytochrome family protein
MDTWLPNAWIALYFIILTCVHKIFPFEGDAAMQKLFLTRERRIVFATVLGLFLSLVTLQGVSAQDATPDAGDATTPDECAACHKDMYQEWEESVHAHSMSSPTFIEALNRAGNPTYCRTCHATGYDPVQGTTQFEEGVGCLACHDSSQHGTVNDSAEVCGQCHSGTHAPDYDQWLVSEHASANIQCGDCHQGHSAELRMEDSTELCQSCHNDMSGTSVHGQADIACIDCHMREGEMVLDSLSGQKSGAGHTFAIPAEVCASCHGMTHTLDPDSAVEPSSSEDVPPLVATEEMSALEAKAERNLNLGLTGGGIGGLALGILIPWVLYRRSAK